MDYSLSSTYSYSTETDHRSDDAATVQEPNWGGNSTFDLLSFFAAALGRNVDKEETWTALVFLSVHIGPWNMFRPCNVYSGRSFSVTLLPRKFVLRLTAIKLDDEYSVKRLLAIKAPKLRPKGETSHNSGLLRSLAKEYQILKTERLAKHKNIVTAYGCCWQTLPTGPSRPTPALILEGTSFGDLSRFSRSRSLTLREQLRLGLDITSGLGALHAHGVVHGDLKPNNILVFNEWGRGYTAKLADFGSAILLSETEFPCRAPPGTRVYRAPECSDDSARLGRRELFKTDLFSLGVTLSFLLVGSHLVDEFMAMSDSNLQSLKEEDQLAFWIEDHRHDEAEQNHESSIFADTDISGLFTCCLCPWLLAADAYQRPDTVEIPTLVLRYILWRHLRTLHPRSSEATSEADGYASRPATWATMAAHMKMSKARLRKLTGERVLSTTRISNEEITAIAHCCFRRDSHLKEAKFIIEYNTNKSSSRNVVPKMASETQFPET
ncbi:unnamed protein product [Parascedosporium putredinis]|uniref:Protein kinase domain-containing protein n=1 Tax=Parascedosporium putredinis TaxID=1442378 RepID=A0A9P1GZT1_9PEZI|nr:unnamed protein product [Parascedosporium putredinis]CAI7993212.1 unnamed protein product [Parascedosporium putredinis]